MKVIDTIREIFDIASILIKFECEDILEKQTSFIDFLNALGVKAPNGREFTKMGFRQLMSNLTEQEKFELIEEFNASHKQVYRMMEMHSNH